MLELVVEMPQTLRTFTDNHYAQASFCMDSLLKNREVRVNGARVAADMPLQKGDVVRYYLTEKQAQKTAYYMSTKTKTFSLPIRKAASIPKRYSPRFLVRSRKRAARAILFIGWIETRAD